MTGHVLERVECTATATKQLSVLEEVIADEKHKNSVLEDTLIQLKEEADSAEERHAASLQASKRVAESERERSEQLRVQLLKHVAISNTQNAELQKCRHMYASLLEEEKKLATASADSISEVTALRKQLEAEELRAEKERELMYHREKELTAKVENLQRENQLISEKLQQTEVERDEQAHEAENVRTLLSAAESFSSNLQVKLVEMDAENRGKDSTILEKLEKIENLRQELEKDKQISRSSSTKLAQAENTIAELDGELTESKKVCLEQKSSIDDLCAIVVDLKSTLKKNHARCKHVEAQRDKVRSQLDSLSEQLRIDADNLSAEKRSLKQQYIVAMEALQNDMKTVSSKNVALEKENSRLLTELDAARTNLSAEKKKLQVSEKRIDELQLAVRVKEKMLDDQGNLITELRDRLNVESEEARQQVWHLSGLPHEILITIRAGCIGTARRRDVRVSTG